MSAARRNVIGEIVRGRRQRAGLTLEQVAERASLSSRTVGNVERGAIKGPHPTTLRAIAAALDFDEADRAALDDAVRDLRRSRTATDGGHVLPRPPRLFAGRSAELSELRTLLTTPGSPVVRRAVLISGGPGVGKTSLALRAASELSKHLPDGAHYVDLRGFDNLPLQVDAVAEAILYRFGMQDAQIPAAPADRVEAAATELRRRRSLVILDNCASADQFIDLVVDAAQSTLVVTSRRRLAVAGGVGLRLAPFDRAASVKLLESEFAAGGRGSEDREDYEQLDALATACGDLPLALTLAARRLLTRPQWSVSFMIDRLRHGRRPLEVLLEDDVDIAAVIDLTYRQLTANAARVLRRMGLVADTDAPFAMIALLADCPDDALDLALEELIAVGIVDIRASGRFSMHDLLRAYAVTKLREDDSAAEIAQAEQRAAGWLLDQLAEAGRTFEPEHERRSGGLWAVFDNAEQVRDWVLRERRNWSWAVGITSQADRHRMLLDALSHVTYMIDRWVAWPEWVPLLEAHIRSAEALADIDQECRARLDLGNLLATLKRDTQVALLQIERARQIGEQHGNLGVQAQALWEKAHLIHHSTSSEEALGLASQARDAYRRIGDPWMALQSTLMIANILDQLDRLDDALREHELALSVLDELAPGPATHEEPSRVVTLNNMARTLLKRGRRDDALAAINEAMRQADDIVFDDFMVHTRRVRADIEMISGNPATARSWLDAANAYAHEHGLMHLIAKLETRLGALDDRGAYELLI